MSAETEAAKGQATDPGATPPQAKAASESEKQDKDNSNGKSKLSDEAAALLKENMSMKSELKKLKAAQEKAETDKLAESGKYKELHDKATQRLSALNQRLIKSEIKAIAHQEGITDPDFCALINLSSVSIDDDGEITGAKEAVAAFKAQKPTLFGTGAAKVPGTPAPGTTAPGGGYKSWDEYTKAPEAERIEWARKHPQAFQALADKAKAARR